jgi:hypothetical protein
MYTVLVAAALPDMRAYIRDCLQGRTDLQMLEPDAGEAALDAMRRLRPDLLIAELAALGGGAALPSGVPPTSGEADRPPPGTPMALLLIVDELPEHAAAWQRRPGAPLSFLVEPFNARHLLHAVARLIGWLDAADRGVD